MRLSISIIPAAILAAFAIAPAAVASAPAPAAQPAATAPAPTPFPAYDNGSALVIAHPVKSGDRLVIKGRPFTLTSVTHPGPAYVAHVQGNGLPASWKGRTLAAVAEG